MDTKKTPSERAAARSAVLDFLAGKGPNPIPVSKRGDAGPATTKFMDEVEAEIEKQDRENNERPAPTAAEELQAVLRLLTDNAELIAHIQKGNFESVSGLANLMGRELSNISRTLSKMAAYGLIRYEREDQRREKKPIWLLPTSKGEFAEWVEAYCLARAIRSKTLAEVLPANMALAEQMVQAAVDMAAQSFDRSVGLETSKSKTKSHSS